VLPSLIEFSMTLRFYVCLLLLTGGIAIGGAFLRPPVRGSVVLSTAIPATARPMQIPDYSGQALRLSAVKISGAIDRTANGHQTTPKLPTPPKVHAAELPIGAWTTETTFVAPVENPPRPSVDVMDTEGRMTLGGPIMRPVGVIEEDGGSPPPVPAVTPTDVSKKPVATPTSLRAPPRSESPRASESTNLFVHPLGF
jgi:hypothetical protein